MDMPITGKIMDIKRFAVHDGPGIRTTFFLKGCPLHCRWCHNPEGISPKGQIAYYAHKCIHCGACVTVCPTKAHSISESGHVFNRSLCIGCGMCEPSCLGNALKFYGKGITVQEMVSVALEDQIFYRESGGGVTMSGGEPLLQADFVLAVAKELKKHGIGVAVDTCGCVPWKAFEKVLSEAEMFLFDIKHIDPQVHKSLTGQENGCILDNISKLSATGARIEVRIPLVPGCNNDPMTIDGIGKLLSQLQIEKVRVLPYHSLARAKYVALGMQDTMPQVESPDDERIDQIVARLSEYGVPAVSGKA